MVSTISVKFALKDSLLTTTHALLVGISFKRFVFKTVEILWNYLVKILLNLDLLINVILFFSIKQYIHIIQKVCLILYALINTKSHFFFCFKTIGVWYNNFLLQCLIFGPFTFLIYYTSPYASYKFLISCRIWD